MSSNRETIPCLRDPARHYSSKSDAAIKQSFRLDDYEHQASYNDKRVQPTTFYSICKLLQEAKEL